ncbi:hypothetical protein TBS_04760 [Thermobispora bispora]|uniref:pseudouridine synthase n=1 Tax=Thermobispora bispora TaxID=2006 RepID=UPI0030E839A6
MKSRRYTPSGEGRGKSRGTGPKDGARRGGLGKPRRTVEDDARKQRGRGGPRAAGARSGQARAVPGGESGAAARREKRTGRPADRPAARAGRSGVRARFGRSGARQRPWREDPATAPEEARASGPGRAAERHEERRERPAAAARRGPATPRGDQAGARREEEWLREPVRDPDFDDGHAEERDTTEVPGGERLQKVLARAGVASRRACEELIGQGRVTVDGQVVRRYGARVDPERQIIRVDGKRIPTSTGLAYYAFNKPAGVVSTMDDPEGRPCLADYVQDLAPRLFHVGRLDTATEGLLLFTNDGELAHRLTHPSYGVRKKYIAKVAGPVPRKLARTLRAGVELEDGKVTVDGFTVIQQHGRQALVEIVLHEGRKHIVRRLMEAVGHPVLELARIEFGPVKLGRLKPGTVRALTLREIGDLYAAVGL